MEKFLDFPLVNVQFRSVLELACTSFSQSLKS